MDERISKLILLYVPSNICNFRCEYCFISHTNNWENKVEFKYDAEQILRGLTKERLGGLCLVNITANGETLLYKDLVNVTEGLLKEGHFVEIVTNCTVKSVIDRLLNISDEYLQHLFFKVSYHVEQLEKNEKLKEDFWTNVNNIKKSVCSFTLEIMPNDNLVHRIPEIQCECFKHVGAVCHATVGRDDAKGNKALLTNMSQEAYVNTWSRLDSEMFRFKMKLFGQRRREFCYAGKWSLLINLANGEAMQCYGRPANQNIFDDPTRKIKFIPVGYSCAQPFCFNGHSHLALGMIPKLNTPKYSQIRDRECEDGASWLKQPIKSFFDQKLYENNKEWNMLKKILFSIYNPFYLFGTLFYDLAETKRRLRKWVYIISGKYKKDENNRRKK